MALALATLLTADPTVCPAQTQPGGAGGVAAAPRRAARGALFISPMGQPFRAAAGEPYPVGRWFAQADRNGDGRIDRAEFRGDAEAFFRTLDTDHNGVIDGFEIASYEHNVVPEILGVYGASVAPEPGPRPQGRGGRRRGKGGDGGATEALMGGAGFYELISEPEPVASADTNLTGKVTLADFLAAADRRFDRLDAKGLGYLTLADLPKTPVQRAAEAEAAAKNKR
jgi:hypothetical protein